MSQPNTTLFFITLFGILIMISATSRTKRAVEIPCTIKPEDYGFHDVLKSEIDSMTKIIEFELHFKNVSTLFWDVIGNEGWFKPTRWYYANADRAERLLLLFHYYFGLLRPMIQIGVTFMDVSLVVEPPDCLQTLSSDQIQNLLLNVVLEKFDLTQNSTIGLSATENKHACTLNIVNDNGWGKVAYNCCMHMEDGDASCEIIADDIWVWVLRGFIMSVAIILFLFWPMFIPTNYKTSVFSYYPPSGLVFNVRKTGNSLEDVTNAQVVNFENIKKLKTFSEKLKVILDDIVFHIKVRKMEFSVCYDRLLGENEAPVGMLKLLFNALLRCKIRHSDPLEKCCNTSVFGDQSCGRGPRWYRFLQIIRTIFVFCVLALPAIPLFYNLCNDQLTYRQVAQHIRYLGLKQSYNFDVGIIWGKVIVAILSVTYLIHVIVVVVDGAMDQSLGKLYNDLIEISNADMTISKRIKSLGRLIQYIFLPIQKFGFFVIPPWLIILVLSPLALCLYIIFTSPTINMVCHIFSLLRDWIYKRRTCNGVDGNTGAEFAEKITFTLTLISVFVILTIGFDFLLQVVAMFIVNMLINVKLTMRILPLILLVLFYIKDTFNGVSSMYSSYHNTILKHVQGIESDDLKREANKNISEQEDKIFQIISPNETDRVNKKTVDVTKKHAQFKLKNDRLRMKTKSLILFLDKNDTAYISKKFFYHTVDIECPGVPGYVEEAVLRAFFDFLKIVLFLAFILFVVMAYGDSHYISPSGQFFATFVSGMIPFVLRKFFLKVRQAPSLDTSSLRFQTQLVQRIESFKQTWPIEDIVVDSVTDAVLEPRKIKFGTYGNIVSKWNMSINANREMDAQSADLVVNTCRVSRKREQRNDYDRCCFCYCFTCSCFSGAVTDLP